VDERCHLLPVAFQTSDAPSRIPDGEVGRLPGGVDVDAARQRVGDLERRIAERARERIPQYSRPLLAELDDKIGQGRALPRRPQ
jgi:hypothetical protein